MKNFFLFIGLLDAQSNVSRVLTNTLHDYNMKSGQSLEVPYRTTNITMHSESEEKLRREMRYVMRSNSSAKSEA